MDPQPPVPFGAREGADAGSDLAVGERNRANGGFGAKRVPAFVAPFVCDTPAGKRGGSSDYPGTAGAFGHFNHADLHARGPAAIKVGALPVSSAGAASGKRNTGKMKQPRNDIFI